MSVTFNVSDVLPVTTPIETVSAQAAVHCLTSRVKAEFDGGQVHLHRPPLRRCEAIGCSQSQLVGATYHPFVEAVGRAFDEHRPLRLSPDHVWLVIEQGLALHVQENAESLRSRFVRHAGRERITVRRDDFVLGQDNPWHEMVDAFRAEIRSRIGKKHDLFVVDFSTTTGVSRTASSIVLLGAMKSYFEYEFISACGIPRITLDGTTDDWRSVLERIHCLREFDLGDWADTLRPVLEQFVDASQGRVDPDFWRSFYKLNDASGGPYITGWVQLFFPYIGKPSGPLVRSEHHRKWRRGMSMTFGGGPAAEELPAGLSAVPFRWQYLTSCIEMEMLGGFLGVEQDSDGTVSPSIGWAVRRST